MTTTITPPSLPPGMPSYLAQWLNTFVTWVVRELRYRPVGDETPTALRLAAPNGTVYRITVSNAGVLGVEPE